MGELHVVGIPFELALETNTKRARMGLCLQFTPLAIHDGVPQDQGYPPYQRAFGAGLVTDTEVHKRNKREKHGRARNSMWLQT
jgi:hypothetical protein